MQIAGFGFEWDVAHSVIKAHKSRVEEAQYIVHEEIDFEADSSTDK